MEPGTNKQFEIGKVFSKGWQDYKRNWKLLTAVTAGAGLVSWLTNEWAGQSLVWAPVVSVLVGGLTQFVVVKAGLGAARGKLEAGQLTTEGGRFFQFLVAYVLVGVAVLLGLVLLVVPGIVLWVALQLTPFVVIDQKKRPIEALYASADLTRGVRWQLFGLLLAIIVLNVVGAVAFVVGLVVTVPLSYVLLAEAYEELTSSGGGRRVAAV